MTDLQMEKAALCLLLVLLFMVAALAAWWMFLQNGAWDKQQAIFLKAHENGYHADAIDAYEANVDIKWTPFHVNLSEAHNPKYAMEAAQSYEHLGMTEKAEREYLRVIGWSPMQYEAYCSLNDQCDAGQLALLQR